MSLEKRELRATTERQRVMEHGSASQHYAGDDSMILSQASSNDMALRQQYSEAMMSPPQNVQSAQIRGQAPNVQSPQLRGQAPNVQSHQLQGQALMSTPVAPRGTYQQSGVRTPMQSNVSPQMIQTAGHVPTYDQNFLRLETLIMKQVAGLKLYIEEKLNEKFDELQRYVDMEIARVSSRVDDLETKTERLETHMEEADMFNPDTTVIAENMPYEESENLDEKVNTMIRRDLGLRVTVLRTKRLPTRPPRQTRQGIVTKPGLVKIQFPSLEEKIEVLRKKRELNNSQDYNCVFLRSSKDHTQRTMEMNFKTLLDLHPQGKEYMITGNGRLVKRNVPRNDAPKQNNA